MGPSVSHAQPTLSPPYHPVEEALMSVKEPTLEAWIEALEGSARENASLEI